MAANFSRGGDLASFSRTSEVCQCVMNGGMKWARGNWKRSGGRSEEFKVETIRLWVQVQCFDLIAGAKSASDMICRLPVICYQPWSSQYQTSTVNAPHSGAGCCLCARRTANVDKSGRAVEVWTAGETAGLADHDLACAEPQRRRLCAAATGRLSRRSTGACGKKRAESHDP